MVFFYFLGWQHCTFVIIAPKEIKKIQRKTFFIHCYSVRTVKGWNVSGIHKTASTFNAHLSDFYCLNYCFGTPPGSRVLVEGDHQILQPCRHVLIKISRSQMLPMTAESFARSPATHRPTTPATPRGASVCSRLHSQVNQPQCVVSTELESVSGNIFSCIFLQL